MKIVINRCWGGFGLSHAAIMRYAKLKGIKLYAFTKTKDKNGNLDFHKFEPYDGKEEVFVAHYATAPLTKKGTYKEGTYWSYYDIERNDPLLVQVVEELGEAASDSLSNLVVREIPDDIEWEINDYDGMETIEEKHRSW